jgi:signal transduction histidine kinase
MRLSRARLWGIGAAALLIGAALAPLVATADFESERGLWAALTVVIGGSFAGVGLFAWYRRPDNMVGPLMVATAVAWYLGILERTDVSPLFTLGILFDSLFVVTAIHLVLAFPTGRLESRFDRWLVGLSYLVVTVGFVPLVLFTDPNAVGCSSCPDNLLLVNSSPTFAKDWLHGVSVIGIVLAVVVIGRLFDRWRRASLPLRRTVTAVFAAGAALELILAVTLFLTLTGVSHQVVKVLFYSALIPFGLVPFLFLFGLLKGRVLRGRGLGALVHRLGAGLGPGELRAALADALGDPSVELAYWLPESEQYVDAEGRPVQLSAAPAGRGVTEVERDGRRIAAIIHDPTLLDDPELVHAAGAAAALSLENERLEAELRAKVEELRASRARLIEVGLSQRRRLERDLHDGAQQALVSLALTLHIAEDKLGSDSDDAKRLLERARGQLDGALKGLRELARGIHPAVLTDRGLGAAVEALAHRAPLPVKLNALPSGRYPEHVEVAAYFVVSEALTNVAKYASASRASIAVVQDNGLLTVEVNDDGIGGAELEHGTGLRGLAARLESIDGRLNVESEPGRGTTVRASIPCG